VEVSRAIRDLVDAISSADGFPSYEHAANAASE
jgi:hypothetical protein